MNEYDVHLLLEKLHECKEPFKVIFSGKKNAGANGSYYFHNHNIVIHNRNFIGGDGKLNENSLIYTAMHELAHHIQSTERGEKVGRYHTKLFHSILDGLADRAEGMGLYRSYDADDVELGNLVKMARALSQGIATLQRELGETLIKLNNACLKKGVRVEDVVKRKAQISTESFRKAVKIAQMDLPEGINADAQEAIAGERDGERRAAMVGAAMAGKSPAQVRLAGSPEPDNSRNGEDEMDGLLREKERLEKTIASLRKKLTEVMARITSRGGGGLRSPCAADAGGG